ncbi:MAG: patatin-like phospholipase family protein [Bacteroidetes bacterium]|nr:patatin-like phospholipase family protein [Bacteroidota bacterium]MDA1121823.1 patatin-like phospholipase family protein [Bacteroidota bacterium]
MKENPPKTYTPSVKDVINAEKYRIGVQGKDEKLFGLALSGGGIRSASFGLGLLQALVSSKDNMLKKLHYMSTVSGGGYIGSSLTWFLNQGLPDGTKAGTSPENFPFGAKNIGARNFDDDEKTLNRNLILDFIRQHGNYLTPGKGLDFVSLIGIVIRSTFVSLLVYFSLLTLLMGGLVETGAFRIKFFIDLNILLNGAVIGVGLILLFAVIYSMTTLFKAQYSWLIMAQKTAGWAWTMVLTLTALGLIPLLMCKMEDAIAAASATTGGVVGVLLGLFEQFRSRKPDEKEGAISTTRILLGVVALTYSLLIFSYLVANFLLAEPGNIWLFIPLAIVIIVGLCVNLNIFGLHRMYRDRLMETFMANKDNIKNNEWGPATEANHTNIEDMCAKNSNPRPYHIINTNLVTTDSHHSKFNGRGGDNFILSPLYCGSDATGWQETKYYRKDRFRNKGITLATAMAISGAAVNPSAGPNGQGLTKNKLISILLGLLNIQLGFWSDNPNPKKKSFMWFPSNFLWPGLFGNVLGRDLSENKRSILLTDGGHFENLALYELIRRRLQVIICSDAGCDPDFKFEDLTNLIEKVRVDFGVSIIFRKDNPLKDLIPDQKDGAMGDKLLLAKKGYAVADIYYSEKSSANKHGVLIYIKTTLTSELPADLYGYKLNHPTYPDETTADQFFSEVQFEAYRELGFQLGKNVDWKVAQ